MSAASAIVTGVRFLAASILLLLVACRESSVACEVVRALAGSPDRSRIEDPLQQPLLRACLLRDDALEQAGRALRQPADPDED